MDALLLLHPIDTAIGREARDRGDYFLDADGRARHRATADSAPYLFASISVCDARLLQDSPDGPFSLLKLWNRAEAAGRLFGLVHDGQWFHVGTPHALAEAERVLR
jgi:MurNAc alpha-1-phosphate uridylyltransferase